MKLSIASWIREWVNSQKDKDGAQADLSVRTGVSEATISNIMSGTLKPGFKMLIGLHFGLGAHPNEVMRFPHDDVARGITAPHAAPRAKKRAS